MSRPHFYPTPSYPGQPDDLDLAGWDDSVLIFCAGFYRGKLLDKHTPENERAFYQRHADLTQAEILARKLAQ